jgi:UDP-N-acetyl-D-mannosaminuronic acid dehydrogenase
VKFKYDICIVGGVGHVGLPLGLLFKSKGKKVVLFDLDLKNINKVNNGIMPFKEFGADKFIKKKNFKFFRYK